MKYTKLFIVLTAVFVSFTSCSSDDGGDEPVTNTPTNPAEQVRVPLTVDVSERPMSDASAAREGMTRTDITTKATLSSFRMSRHIDIEPYSEFFEFKKSDGKWAAANESSMYWPDKYYPFCFYAYDAYVNDIFYWNSGNPYISVTVDENAFKQKDILVAKSIEFTAAKKPEETVRLTFDHICAAVGFTIKITDKLQAKLGNSSFYVTNIKLQAIAKSGDYYYDSGWTGSSLDQTYYTLTYTNGMEITTEQKEMKDPQGNTFYLFMIPQTCTASLEVKYRIGESGEENTTTIGGININWQAGYRYFIDINLGTANIQVQ